MKIFLIILALCVSLSSFAQSDHIYVGSNNISPSAILELDASDRGILIPRMTSIQRNAIVSPANGLLVYDTNYNEFWYYNVTEWTNINTVNGLRWDQIIDDDGDTRISVEETPDNDKILFYANNQLLATLITNQFNLTAGTTLLH